MINILTCSKCKQQKPTSEFQVDNRVSRGFTYQCKECRKVYKKTSQWHEYSKKYVKEHLEDYREAAARRRREAISLLGGKCECCGEKEYKFLAIDHIHGLHLRDRTESGNALVNKVRKNPKAKEIYRILCHNCNSAIGFYGFCPHNNLD